jgi:hypothetical protein
MGNGSALASRAGRQRSISLALGGQAGGIQEFLGLVGFSQHHFNTPDLAVLLFWVGDGGGGKWQVRSWDHEEDE